MADTPDVLKRLEEIERERDEARAEAARWLEQREELAGLLTVEQERSRGLQADLDAALLVIVSSEVSLQQEAEYVGQHVVDACERIEALLEKRREENRG